MGKSKIKVHYIYHSGFAVETKNHFLIFDYYLNPQKEKNTFNPIKFELEDLIKTKENILVFSSHGHGDHFNPEILEWENINPNIKYILSSDITIKNWKDNYYKLSQYEELLLEDKKLSITDKENNLPEASELNNNTKNIHIKTYGSTDIGISFLVKVEGVTLFHAGDLNWWDWKDEPDEERKLMEKNFKLEIAKIKGESIDIAFFPVDPRLEEYYSIGAEYFIKELKPNTLIPMHFGDKTYITKEFAEKVKDLPVSVLTINDIGEELRVLS